MGTAAGPGTGFLEPTFKRSARIWWAWVWRSVIFGGAAGLFGSLVLSLSGILDRVSEKTGQYLGAGIGIALAIPVGIWVFQMVLEKDFGEFRIRLVPKGPIKSDSRNAFLPMGRKLGGDRGSATHEAPM
jgi:hypothetical protein